MNEDIERVEAVEIISAGETLGQIERASIDTQIATAKQYPRDLVAFKRNAIALATMDDETAVSCIYRRPVGKDNRTGEEVFAEGMSIRMAEIVAASYGNLRVGCRAVSQSERQVVVQGVAHDLESNFLSTSEVAESTVTSTGKPMSERMRIVILKAASAKARRDAIFQVVPRAVCKPVETAVREVLFGNAESLSKWRAKMQAWAKALGIDEKRVWLAVGADSAADLTQGQVETLIGLANALKASEITLDEAFPETALQGRFRKPERKPAASPEPPITPEGQPEAPVISDAQKRRLYAIGKQQGLSNDEMTFIMQEVASVRDSRKIPVDRYDAVVSAYQAAAPGTVIPKEG